MRKLRQVLEQLPRKIPLIFGICFYHTVSLLLLLSCLLTNETFGKLYKRKLDLLFQMLRPIFFIVSITQYVENFNLQIPHYHIFRGSLKIQSRSLRLYFRKGRSSPYNFSFASLVSKTKTNTNKEIANKRRK